MVKKKSIVMWVLATALILVLGVGVGFTFMLNSAKANIVSAEEVIAEVTLDESDLNIENSTLKGLNAQGQSKVEGGKTYQINLPDSVTTIDGNVESSYFDDKLVAVKVSEDAKLQFINQYAFYECKGLVSFIAGNSSLTGSSQVRPGKFYIRQHAFDGCSALKIFGSEFLNQKKPGVPGVYLNNVMEFGDYAFANCTSMEIIGATYWYLETIGNHTFYNCTNLKYVSVWESEAHLKSIGESTFEGCTSLLAFYLPDNDIVTNSVGVLTSVGKNTFKGCSSLKAINIPKELTQVGTTAEDNVGVFEGCTGLEVIVAKDKEHEQALQQNPENFGIEGYTDKITHMIDLYYAYEGRGQTHKKLYQRSVDWCFDTSKGWTKNPDYALPTDLVANKEGLKWYDSGNITLEVNKESLNDKLLNSQSDTITLYGKYPLSEYGYNIDWGGDRHTYNCEVQCPKLVCDSNYKPVLGVDYTATIYKYGKDNVLGTKPVPEYKVIDAGMYSYVLKAIDNRSQVCYGEYSIKFYIAPLELSSESIELTCDIPSNLNGETIKFDGQEHKPKVQLKLRYGDGLEYTLKENLDYYYVDTGDAFYFAGEHYYELTTYGFYENSQDPDEYTGGYKYGNFTGRTGVTITITKVLIGNKEDGDQYIEPIFHIDPNYCVFKGEYLEPDVRFQLPVGEGDPVNILDDFDVMFDNNYNVGTCHATATALEKNRYCEGSFEFEFEITPASLDDVTISFDPFSTYDGTNQQPDGVLKLRNYKLNRYTDYDIEYDEDMLNVGKKTIKFVPAKDTQHHNFTGSITKDFTISKLDINNDLYVKEVNIRLKSDSVAYTGNRIDPDRVIADVVVKLVDGDRTLTIPWDDYNRGSEGVNVGEATVGMSVKEDSNFKGSARQTFTITPAQMGHVVITKFTTQQMPYFDGKEHKIGGFSQLELKQFDQYTLKESDYELVFEGDDYTNFGSKTVIIRAKSSNFQGEIINTYEIRKRSLSTSSSLPYEIKVNYGETPVYTGKQICPKVESIELKFNAGDNDYYTMLTKDYTIDYGENINAGNEATIIISATSGGNFTGQCIKYFSIARKPIEDADIEFNSVNIVYDGKAHMPDPQFSINDVPFVKGKDYTIVGEEHTDAGTYSLTIQSISTGNLSGDKILVYQIERRDIADAEVKVSLYYGDHLEFNGWEQGQGNVILEVTIDLGGGDKLTLTEKDYTASYSDNLYPGQAKVTITGNDGSNYQGTAQGTFEIVKGHIGNMYMFFDDIVYDGKEHKNLSQLQFGQVTLTEGIDYNVTYDSDMTNAGKKKIKITAIPGKYFVESEADATLKIKPVELGNGQLEVTLEGGTSFGYTGSQIMPRILSVKLRKNYSDVVFDILPQDYTLSYGDNINVGTGTITFNGNYDHLDEEASNYNCNFSGYNVTYFDITKRDISSGLNVTLDQEQYSYTGSGINPTIVSIEVDGLGQLNIQPSDYMTYCSSNVNVGRATMTISANYYSNFTGEYVVYFNIVARNMSEVDIETLSDIVFDGEDHKPTNLNVRIGYNTLTKDADYELVYNSTDYTNYGEKSVTVKAKSNNLIGERIVTFTISKRDLSSADRYTFNYEGGSYFTYTGNKIAPRVSTVIAWFGYDDIEINEAEYDVSYGENINAGTGTVTITAKADGNCTGSHVESITINQAYNEFVQEFNLQNFKTGDNISEPVVITKFGTATITYDDFNEHTYTFSQLRNANPGHYRATIRVEGTENYYELSTTREFDILDKNGNMAGGGSGGGNQGGTSGQTGGSGNQGGASGQTGGSGNQGGTSGNNGNGDNNNSNDNNNGGGSGVIIAVIAGAVGVVTLAAVSIIIVKVKKGKKKKS